MKAKGDEMVADLAKCQQKLGGGYLSAFPMEFLDRLDARKKVWAPFYTMHKIMAGMLDMYQLAATSRRWRCWRAWRNGRTTGPRRDPEEHMQDILNTEYGGMNEALYNLAAVTGDDRYAHVGRPLHQETLFQPAGVRAAMSCAACT